MRIAVIGTGLMGTSVALAARRRGDDVAGWDPDPDVLARAAARDALEPADGLESAIRRAELVVVAAPIGQLPQTVAAVLAATTDATVTDVGSTKASVVKAAERLAALRRRPPDLRLRSARPRSRQRSALRGRHLVPHAGRPHGSGRDTAPCTPSRPRLGATPVAIDADAHDRLVAMTSHVPHVLANIVANQTGASRIEGHEPLAHAGGSLRDMTRIAGANPRIWVDIYLDNADAIRAALQEHRRRIEQVESALEQGDAGFLARWIGEASQSRRRMLEREYPDPGTLQRVRVHVPDRPGVLAGITQALGAERINIEDFELHHVSPERGGTLTLLVAGEAEAQRAAALLESQGYSVVVSAVIDAD